MTTLAINPLMLFQLVFYVLALASVIHALIFSYHWWNFGADRRKSITGIVVYLVGLIGFFILLAIGLAIISGRYAI